MKKVPKTPDEKVAKSLVLLAREIRNGFEVQSIDKPFGIRPLFALAEMIVRIRELTVRKGGTPPAWTKIIEDAIDMSIAPKYSKKDVLTIKNMASTIGLI